MEVHLQELSNYNFVHGIMQRLRPNQSAQRTQTTRRISYPPAVASDERFVESLLRSLVQAPGPRQTLPGQRRGSI